MSAEVPEQDGRTRGPVGNDGREPARQPQAGATSDGDRSRPPEVPEHELLRRIGSGSYGDVWLARNALGTMRAIKVVYRRNFDDPRPFEREFTGIRQFEPISRMHEGLVDVLQVGGGADSFYYVMELADDASGRDGLTCAAAPPDRLQPPDPLPDYMPRTLRSDLQRRGSLPVSECLRIGRSLSSALAYLHERGLVHRDLKPSNIIFVNGAPKLADIGLVARADESQSLVGTLGFIPPEGSGTPRADLFSLGKVFYEMSTGRDRREFPQLPVDLRERSDASVLVEFNEIVLKACANDPEKRYASAAELSGDLTLLGAGRSVRRLRVVERHLALALRAGLVLVALLVVAGGFYFAARRQAQTNARLAATNAALAATNARLAADTVRQLYAAEMNLAFQAWDGGNLPRARALLARHGAADPDLRGFEWLLLQHLCGESDARLTLSGHTGIVWSAAWSPDDRHIATAGADGWIQIWDAGNGTLQTNLPGTGVPVHTVAFSPDGRILASGGRDDRVTLRDTASWTVRHQLSGHQDAVRALAFSSDGRQLASGGEDRQIRLWEAGSGVLLASFAESMKIERLAFSPHSPLLAAAGNDVRAHLWDLDRQEMRPVAPGRSLLKAVAFPPSGRMLAAAGYDGITELWDLDRHQSLGPVGSGAPIDALDFSSDGRWLATAGADATIHLWNAYSRQQVRQLRGHTAGVRAVAFSHDGRWLVSAAEDGTARVWEMYPPSEERHELAHRGDVNAVAFAPDSRELATTSGRADELRRWNSRTGEDLGKFTTETNAIWCVVYAADGGAIFTGGEDGSLRRWSTSAGGQTHFRQVYEQAIDALAVSPDGRSVATACRGAPIQLWDAGTLEPAATLPGPAQTYRSVAFSPDGVWLAASGRTNQVSVWNVVTRQRVTMLPGHRSEVRSVAFSPDGRTLATADHGRVIRLWAVPSWRLEARLEGHDAPIKSLSFTPDSRTLASGSVDGTVKLWNLRLRQEVATLRGHGSQVKQIAFAPDGSLLATAGGDGMVRLWRASQSILRSR